MEKIAREQAEPRTDRLVWGKNAVTELLKSGGAVDTVYLADSLPQPVAGYYTALAKQTGAVVVVDNRAGANGTIGGKAVELAPADGTTLLFSAATHVLARQVMSSPPYDPQTAFAPVARVGEASPSPFVI